MLKSLSQLAGAKVAFATVLLHLISSSHAIYAGSSGQAHLDLTVRTMRTGYGRAENEWSNRDDGQGVRVTLGTFPQDKRLLVGEVVIPRGVMVTEIRARYFPNVNTQCVVLGLGQGLADLEQARSLPLIVDQARDTAEGLRIFCAELIEGREDPYVTGFGAGASE